MFLFLSLSLTSPELDSHSRMGTLSLAAAGTPRPVGVCPSRGGRCRVCPRHLPAGFYAVTSRATELNLLALTLISGDVSFISSEADSCRVHHCFLDLPSLSRERTPAQREHAVKLREKEEKDACLRDS